eukprot:3411263-Pyramimonas_sp.AAC.1
MGAASSGRARTAITRSRAGSASLRAAGSRTLARTSATARPRPWTGDFRPSCPSLLCPPASRAGRSTWGVTQLSSLRGADARGEETDTSSQPLSMPISPGLESKSSWKKKLSRSSREVASPS